MFQVGEGDTSPLTRRTVEHKRLICVVGIPDLNLVSCLCVMPLFNFVRKPFGVPVTRINNVREKEMNLFKSMPTFL
jgi:hypothetical protein